MAKKLSKITPHISRCGGVGRDEENKLEKPHEAATEDEEAREGGDGGEVRGAEAVGVPHGDGRWAPMGKRNTHTHTIPTVLEP